MVRASAFLCDDVGLARPSPSGESRGIPAADDFEFEGATAPMKATKTNPGNFFEDYKVGQILTHATPRTVTEGDVALYMSLYGPRFAVQSSDTFAKAIGYPRAPVDDLLMFHVVFGKTVPDISLNAIANLGYARDAC